MTRRVVVTCDIHTARVMTTRRYQTPPPFRCCPWCVSNCAGARVMTRRVVVTCDIHTARRARDPRDSCPTHGHIGYNNHLLNYLKVKVVHTRLPSVGFTVLGSQPASDVSHKPGGRLSLLSARPAVTFATLKRAAANFAA